MTITEFIEQLLEIRARKGDVPVRIISDITEEEGSAPVMIVRDDTVCLLTQDTYQELDRYSAVMDSIEAPEDSIPF